MSGRRSDAFIGLAVEEKWTEVFAQLDRSEAGVDDYEVHAQMRASAEAPPAPAAPVRPFRRWPPQPCCHDPRK